MDVCDGEQVEVEVEVENVMENLTRVGWMYVMGNRWRAEEEACAA